MRGVRGRLAESAKALREVFANPDLGRLELAWGFYWTAETAWLVALGVYAYEAGGAFAVGLVGFLRMLPAAAMVPFGSLLADRFRRERVLLAVYLLRALVLGGMAAAAAAGAPVVSVYAATAFAGMLAAPCRPAQWAIIPDFARTPRELVAANAALSTVEGLAYMAGPALAAAVLAAAGPALAFAVAGGLALVAGALILRTAGRAAERPTPLPAESVASALAAGWRTVAGEPHPRLLIGLFGAQTYVRGALNVLIVVAALDLLDIGQSGVGLLTAALGAGGFVGAAAALGLAGRPRLAGPFGIGLVMWGLPIALAAAWLHPLLALVCLAAVGAGNSILNVAGFTLLQRLVPNEVLGRVFGVLETLVMAAVAMGALATSFVVDALGGRTALILTGAILPVLAALFRSRVDDADAAARVPGPELALLRGVAMFAPLSPMALERLASRLLPVAASAGTTIIREGEVGDRFYVLAEGEVSVAGRTLGPGDFFGEIALVLDVPRTATVTALTDASLYALERVDFLDAVGRHPASARAARAVVGVRLGFEPS
jgi:MFS family permease